MDYRRWFDDSGMLYSYDLEDHQGRDVVVQIEKAFPGEVIGENGRKSKKPIVKFVGLEKTLALNKTNGKSIKKMYGKDAESWPGKWVALFVTTCEFGGETRDCIRIRPKQPDAPRAAQSGKRPPAKEVDIESIIAAYGGCDDMEMFEALESDRKAAWGAIGKDDKPRVKDAAVQAHKRMIDAESNAATKAHVADTTEPATTEESAS